MAGGGHHAPKASSNGGGGGGLIPSGVIVPGLMAGIALAVLAILAG